uniref:solute carrier family 22 member 15-like isoform X2 n=1 Tax=Styela clava TaxID=7725 RepID=UPI0019398A02|nr:solute carrier family 22 member 15-like isoform X2 [Styela clava]
MDIEEAFIEAGSFGKFQIVVTLINYCSNILFGSQMVIMVVVGATPNKDIPSEANLTTIVTEWNLYDEQWVIDLMGSLFFAGYIAGSFIFGQLPDLYGRKRIMIIRMLYQIFFSFGVMLLSLLGYLLQDWRKIIMVSCGMCVLLLPCFIFLIPESPRWLYSVGRIDEAERIMIYIAKKNGKDDTVIHLSKEVDISHTDADFKKHSLVDLLKIRKLTIYLVVGCYLWFACSLSYYGLTLDAADLTPNLFVAIVLSGAVEIPGYILTIVMMDHRWFGRKGTTVLLLLASSLTSICICFLGDTSSGAKTALGLISKLTIAAGFSILYVYLSEIFPTQLRTIALIVSNVFARIGGIVAPFVPLLSSTAYYLPYVVFGVGTLIAGAAGLALPETYNRKLVVMSDFVEDKRPLVARSRVIDGDDESINADDKDRLLT